MYYCQKGSGKCIVLLHGWGNSSKTMAFIQDALAINYCVINVDLAGFGRSAEPDSVWSVYDYACKLHELLESLELEVYAIIAHSFGARIALQYALHYPCPKLVISGGAGIKSPLTLKQKIKIAYYKLSGRKHSNLGSSDYQNASEMMKKIMVKALQDDIKDELVKIKAKTYLFWGSKDEATPLWMGKMMEERIPDARMRIVNGGNHFAFSEHRALFLYDIKHFLDEVKNE